MTEASDFRSTTARYSATSKARRPPSGLPAMLLCPPLLGPAHSNPRPQGGGLVWADPNQLGLAGADQSTPAWPRAKPCRCAMDGGALPTPVGRGRVLGCCNAPENDHFDCWPVKEGVGPGRPGIFFKKSSGTFAPQGGGLFGSWRLLWLHLGCKKKKKKHASSTHMDAGRSARPAMNDQWWRKKEPTNDAIRCCHVRTAQLSGRKLLALFPNPTYSQAWAP